MADIISAVLAVVQCLAPSVGRRIKLWREFKSNFELLKRDVKALKAQRMSIQRDVEEEKKSGHGIRENVEIWLTNTEETEKEIQEWLVKASKIIGDDQKEGEIRTDEEISAAGEIEGGAEIAAAGEIRADKEKTAAKKSCFKGPCPNLKLRYQLSKKAEKLLKDVAKHQADGKFDKISYRAIPEDPRLSSVDYEAFNSQSSTLEDVINSLSDPTVNIVGIHGRGGIGKTTLAKAVANRSKTNELFDLVIYVELPEKPVEMTIRREIAQRLGVTLSSDEVESIAAGRLWQQLKKGKKENKAKEEKENKKTKILIIFDNIWVHLDLQAIGIPLGDESKVRKVLLTSREKGVLRTMGSELIFDVQLLDDEDAWEFFKKNSRDDIEGSEFESAAREVTKKCEGLPIVIKVVARRLKYEELRAWEDASRHLEIEDLHGKMEWSFNRLRTEQLKTILLIGYANITSIDKLLMYGMVVPLFKSLDNMEERRRLVLTSVRHLKDSSLLFDSNTTGEDFSMHDIVREVAIKIASKKHRVFRGLHDDFESLAKNARERCRSIVLNDVKPDELPQVLKCQQLHLLAISGVCSFSNLEIHDKFFTSLTELKVLVLSNMELLSLPSSLRSLTNLRALGLYHCRLDEIAIIGDLKKLETLSLEDSEIEKLPEEVGQLTQLKSLDLRGCSLGVIAPYVLSTLSHLEELYMGEFCGWEEDGLNKDRKNVSLDELKHLSSLTGLEIQIKDAKTLPRGLSFKKLKRYKIMIGPDEWWHICQDGTGIPRGCRIFSLSLINTNICLNNGHLMELKEIEDLCLVGSLDMECVLFGLDRDGFQQLKYLQVRDNDNVLYIVDAMKYATNNALPVLESLRIGNLINLKKISHGRLTTASSFSKLRKIEVGDCAKLENIFSFSVARRLQLLESIVIFDCDNMKEIFAIERGDESDSNISEVLELNQLRSLRLRFLPQFKSLEDNSNCSNTLFSGKVALPNLEVLAMYELNVERIWKARITAMSSGIQNLTRLILWNCDNLRCLFSSSLIRSIVGLQHLEIWLRYQAWRC